MLFIKDVALMLGIILPTLNDQVYKTYIRLLLNYYCLRVYGKYINITYGVSTHHTGKVYYHMVCKCNGEILGRAEDENSKQARALSMLFAIKYLTDKYPELLWWRCPDIVSLKRFLYAVAVYDDCIKYGSTRYELLSRVERCNIEPIVSDESGDALFTMPDLFMMQRNCVLG
jgi:hypothetical protein